MKKRVLSILLVFLLAITSCVPAFAVTYQDLSNHWAKDAMKDLVQRGLLSGYSDHTMQPDKNMTACELLVMLSRFYTLTDIQKEKIESDYKEIVKQYVPARLSWAKEPLSVCLAAGIITKVELRILDLFDDVEKQQLAVFLVRTMQHAEQAELLRDQSLSYTDAEDIATACRGSVAELFKLDIIKGDESNQFCPKSDVTRAVVAAMVSRCLKYLEKNDVTLALEAYKELTVEEGIIVSVNGSCLQVCGFDGLVREYNIPDAAKVMVNEETEMLSSSYEDCYTEIMKNKETVTSVKIEKDSSESWVQGSISSINASSGSVYIRERNDSRSTKYVVPSEATITKDGKKSRVSSLDRHDFISLKRTKHIVTDVHSMSSKGDIHGTVTEINFGEIVSLKIKEETGMQYCFSLDIADLPTIKRGDIEISVDRLKVGNEVTAKFKNGEVSSILAKGAENKLNGKLTSITKTVNGTVWSILSNNGTEKSYMVDEGAGVYSGTTSILLSQIQVGDVVSAVIYGNMITEVYLQSAVTSTNKVSGRVLTTENRVITILTPEEKLIYVDVSSVGTMASAGTGKTISLSSIKKNSVLIAYGTYQTATDFLAKLVVLEG